MLSHALRAKVQNGTLPTPTDPNFNQVSLLLHGDGTNGAQNNTFIDSSTNNFTVTRNGNTTQGTNTPFSQVDGAWNNYFNGTTDYLRTSLINLSADFTIECWIYPLTTADQFVASSASNNIQIFRLNIGGAVGSLSWYNGATATATNVITLNTWQHVAISRTGSTVKMFVNGVVVDTTTNTGGFEAGCIGKLYVASGFFNGYVSNFRVVTGTGIYTSNFTPSTTPLTAITNTSLLTCQSNYFKDNSSNNFTLTATGTPSVQPFSPFAPTAAYSTSVNGGSMYFDGTGDYLTVPANAAYTFGTGDFTLECWVNFNALVAYGTVFCTTTSYITSGNIYFGLGATNYLTVSASGTTLITASSTISLSSWNHIAVVRSGTTLTLYLNGVSVGSVTNSTNFSSDTPQIGAISGSYAINGYISNLRVIKGTAVYTAAFTPPTAPLTAITNTSLLLSGTNAGIVDNAIKNDLETVGNSQVGTSVKKYGTGSMSFDGTGDWLTSPDTPNLQLNTGNFTIEGWVYLNAVGAVRGFVSKGTSTTGWSLGATALNQIIFNYASSSITSTGVLVVSTWYFVTVVREGTGSNQTKIYINGTNDGTGTVATNFNQTSIMYVGADRVGGSALNGYIDDLRITKGVARYTANFTAPTSAFPNS